jgi:predicted nucleic acid-binding protein
MIPSPKLTVVLDACVLYPAPVRDILLSLAAEGLFKPKWTNHIQDEWLRNLLIKRTDLFEKDLKATIQAMNNAFPDANVENFETLIPNLNLPDKDDRHVLACAIRCNAAIITTFNLKDFPNSELNLYDIEVQNPDELICNLFDLDEGIACKAFDKMVNRLKNPPITKKQAVMALRKCSLKICSDRFEKCL